jgi:hypothetical protein
LEINIAPIAGAVLDSGERRRAISGMLGHVKDYLVWLGKAYSSLNRFYEEDSEIRVEINRFEKRILEDIAGHLALLPTLKANVNLEALSFVLYVAIEQVVGRTRFELPIADSNAVTEVMVGLLDTVFFAEGVQEPRDSTPD